ncbi:hypothetical protein [uncultured Methanobrevibacter sp.]|uniref:hypothetical protein n=1 Tax=uncultured Methanobrevibacter sp. TaxID=253161 RepID=UPI0025DA4EF1|nr:hypothetical protein [uncultured Methanobrevibacter sp.]
MDTKYLIILIVLCIICFGVFFYQLSHDVDTFIVVNETQVSENGTVTGYLMDAYSRGVSNKTIFYHQAGDDKSVLVNVTTDSNGMFKIENVKNIPESGSNNYYGDISFKGEGEFHPCTYERNITVQK